MDFLKKRQRNKIEADTLMRLIVLNANLSFKKTLESRQVVQHTKAQSLIITFLNTFKNCFITGGADVIGNTAHSLVKS